MANEEQEKPVLDADILQCKADLQRALQSAKRVPPQAAGSIDRPADIAAQSLQPLQSEEPEQDKNSPEMSIERLNEQIRALEQRLVGEKDAQNRLLEASEELRKSLAAHEADAQRLGAELEHKNESLEKTLRYLAEMEQQFGSLSDEHRREMAVLEGQVQGKTMQLDEIAEQNRRLEERLEVSEQSADSQRIRIEELERELAEKIGDIIALNQQLEENAAALAAQAQTLRLTGEEKNIAEKHLEAKAAEWAQTLETLKAAQASAAEALSERQHQLDALREDLMDAESRLEQADSTNATLARENAELLETLEHAQRNSRPGDEAVISEFEIEEETADVFEELPPVPYCEPVGEVISEDDVHLEQKLADTPIPAFNLAEQIMAEQRKASAERRQGPGSGREKTTMNGAIEHVMEQYVSNPRTPEAPTSPVEPAERFHRWQGEILSAYQESLLGGIVQKEIRRFCGSDVPLTGLHRAMEN